MIDLKKIADFAKEVHAGNTDGHGFDHIERVLALARRILATEPAADADLVLATCYLHDSYDEKLTKDPAMQKAKVYDFLLNLTGEDFAKKSLEIIDDMSFSSNLTERRKLSLEGQIAQDADRLDAMGAWGIVRTLEYGWSHGQEFYNPEIDPVRFDSQTAYHSANSTTLNHFYEKLFLLQDLLNTEEARRMGVERHRTMRDFVRAIEKEYDESSESSESSEGSESPQNKPSREPYPIKSDRETLVFAHRGSKCNRPENTLAAFAEAIRVGVDGIELDVHLSKDRELMVIHDETIDRTTTGKGLVRDFTRAELKNFDAGLPFDMRFIGQKIPTLREVLSLLIESDFRGVLNIELKTNKFSYPGIEEILSNLMRSEDWPFSYIYSSFNFESLYRMSDFEPDAELCHLIARKMKKIRQSFETDFIDDLHLRKGLVFRHKILARYSPKPLRAWTINSESKMRRAFELQIAGFMTDYPELALKIKEGFKKKR